MTKYFFIAVTLFICINADAQIDTSKYFKSKDYGWIYSRLKPYNILMPTDTSNFKNGVVVLSSGIYLGNGVKWSLISSGGGSSLPEQSGNAKKWLYTDGVNAIWKAPNFADSVDYTNAGSGSVLQVVPGSNPFKYRFTPLTTGIISLAVNAPIQTTGGNTPTLSIDTTTSISTKSYVDNKTYNATVQGNIFNTANKLVQLNNAGALPALDGGLITGLNATNLALGTVSDSRLSSNVSLLNATQLFSGQNTFLQTIKINNASPEIELTDNVSTNNTKLYRLNANNELYLKSKVYEIGGVLSNGIRFDGGNQYAEAATNISVGTNFSISFWVKSQVAGVAYPTVLHLTDGTNAMKISINNGLIRYGYNNNTNYYSTLGGSNTAWIHCVLSFTGSNVSFYINGDFSNTLTVSKLSTITKITVGYQSASLPYPINYASHLNTFILDQLLLYNTALTQANVTTLYSSSSGTSSIPTTYLISRWEFNEGTGTRAYDALAVNDLNFFNSPTWQISGGKIPTDGQIQDGIIIYVRDGIFNGERGQYYFGDPFGATILRGRTVRFTAPTENNISFIHNGNTLLSPTNTSHTTTANSTLSVVGNVSIGSNISALSNGLNVAGETALSGVRFAYVTKSTSYTATNNDETIEFTTSGNTLTLPTAIGCAGKLFTVINSSSGTNTISTTSSQLIGNFNTATTLTVNSDASFVLESNGTKWLIRSKF